MRVVSDHFVARDNSAAAVQNRRPDIQGLRAVAVLMVVAFHAGLPLPGGFVGVDVFFAISGFVITAMLSREYHANGRIRYGRFYLRRFKRLTPALALMVTVTLLLSIAFLSPLGTQKTAAQTGIGAMFLAANFTIIRNTGGYFDADAHTNPLLHTWSLSVEEQFYLVFPVLIALAWRASRRGARWRLAPHLVVATISSMSLLIACLALTVIRATPFGPTLLIGRWGKWIGELIGFYSPLPRLWEFTLGALLALLAARISALPRNWAPLLGGCGAILLGLSLWVISASRPFPSLWTTLPVLGALMLIASGTIGKNPISQGLASRPMSLIGDYSYSIYLWHWPFIVLARTIWPEQRWVLVAAAALSAIPAIASYRLIEQPLRHSKIVSAIPISKVVAVTIGLPLATCMFVIFAGKNAYWSSGIRSMLTAQNSHAYTNDCPHNPSTGTAIRACIFNTGAKGVPIYLVGDSTAWHFSEAAIGAGEILGRPVTVIANTNCRFKNIFSKFSPPEYSNYDEPCRIRYESTQKWLKQQPAGTVLVSDLNFEYYDYFGAVGLKPDQLTRDPTERVRVLNEGLVSTVKELEKSGHNVLIVKPAPAYTLDHLFDPLRCTLVQLKNAECVGTMSAADADLVQGQLRTSLQQVADETGAGIWDPRDFFCPLQRCSTQVDGVDRYRDSIHISPETSRQLAPALAEALSELPNLS